MAGEGVVVEFADVTSDVGEADRGGDPDRVYRRVGRQHELVAVVAGCEFAVVVAVSTGDRGVGDGGHLCHRVVDPDGVWKAWGL